MMSRSEQQEVLREIPITEPSKGEVWQVAIGPHKGRRMAILRVKDGHVTVSLARIPGRKPPPNPVVQVPLDARWGSGIVPAHDDDDDNPYPRPTSRQR